MGIMTSMRMMLRWSDRVQVTARMYALPLFVRLQVVRRMSQYEEEGDGDGNGAKRRRQYEAKMMERELPP
jgi:hypothetical protein